MFPGLLLAAATMTTTVIPPTRPTQANLACSTTYGCEVALDCARLKDVKMWTDRIVARTVGDGDDGTAARIQMIPAAAFTTQPDGTMVPVSGKLTVVTMDGREFTVVVDAVDMPRVNRLWFGCPSDPHPAMTVPLQAAAPSGETSALDPSKMDFGWSSNGDIRCDTVFSVGMQLWCKLPHDLADIPSVYFDDGRLKVPANARVVAQYYLVIENGALHPSILLEAGGGNPRSGHINRSRE